MNLTALLAILALGAPLAAQSRPSVTDPIGPRDVALLADLHRLTDAFGEELWPGFRTRAIPIAINGDDRQELLVGHPDPPPVYRQSKHLKLDGRPVRIRNGVTRFMPKRYGGLIQVGDSWAAYVATIPADMSNEEYLGLILHECFHCFQKRYRRRAENAAGQLPEWDPEYSALLYIESATLRAALDARDAGPLREHARLFAAVRRERRRSLAPALVRLEGEQEFEEGTADYVQARFLELLAKRGEDAPRARTLFDRMLDSLRVSDRRRLTFLHAAYHHGMAQCMILDRLRPRWKEELRERGSTQFALLEKTLAIAPEEERALLQRAKRRFGYEKLLRGQREVIEVGLNRIRRYVLAAGRRYRIHHGKLRGGYKRRTARGLLHIPWRIEEELRERFRKAGCRIALPKGRRNVYTGGIPHLEKTGFLFSSGKVPILYGNQFVEWIDPAPAADRSDLLVKGVKIAPDTYRDARIRTDGFLLKAAFAKIEWSAAIVHIYLAPEGARAGKR